MSDPAELVQVISQLRHDLTAAMRDGQDEDLKFQLGPVEMELTVAVEKSGGPEAKVRLWVVEAGGSGKVASTSTHKIKLVLDPRMRDSMDERPAISGPLAEGER